MFIHRLCKSFFLTLLLLVLPVYAEVAIIPISASDVVDSEAVRHAWLTMVNNARSELWRDSYTLDPYLTNTAQTRANHLRDTNTTQWTHVREDEAFWDTAAMRRWFVAQGVTPWSFTESNGWNVYNCSSNCTDSLSQAIRYTYNFFAAEATKTYQPHRLSIIEAKYKHMGVGVAVGNGKYYLVMHVADSITVSDTSLTPSSSSTIVRRLTDIRGHQYEESIRFLVDRGIVKWYDDGTYWPDRPVNRAEFMKIAMGASIGSGSFASSSRCFSDVQTSDWFAPYVCHAKERGIVKWYDGNLFKPLQYVSKAEALKMWLGSFGHMVAEWQWVERYQPYIEFAHNNNIFSKYALRPNTNMTRGQMAYFTHQLILHKEWKLTFDGVRKVASVWCGLTPPNNPITTLTVNGVDRHFITDIGRAYNQHTPSRLILAFHGRTNSNADVRGYYNLDNVLGHGSDIIIYPSGLPEETSPRTWSNPGDPSSKLRDFALFDAIVEEFSEKYCIHKDQIFVVWHSLGSWFTNSLSCARGDVIRAIGTVGGATTINDCSGPTAAIVMHHPDDNLAPFDGGLMARDQLVRQNSCIGEPVAVAWTPADSQCMQYSCQDDAPVIRCPHTQSQIWGGYYPHGWPTFATPMILSFFAQQK